MSVKGLRKIIYPFAPDQSGAAAVMYETGGMIIIIDAGGCAGNICGFDEPRWLGTKSAIFSAGLRDMDAIMGRDDLMIDKIAKAAKKIDAAYVALIGTPVPATIATDYKALLRMAERRTGLPVVTVDTSGAGWYDEGIEKAYLGLFRKFAEDSGAAAGEERAEKADAVGVLGAVPLDTGCLDAPERIRRLLAAEGEENVICYGEGTGSTGSAAHPLDSFRAAGSVKKNIVMSPAGLAAARFLKEKYGTPYECRDLLAEEALRRAAGTDSTAEAAAMLAGRRVLVIHQQLRANTVRDIIRRECGQTGENGPACMDAATWFMLDDDIKEEGDLRIREESDFFDLIENGGYDVIMADPSFRKAARGFKGRFMDLPHFAVSGQLED